MIIDWPKFAAALLLLLTPIALFHGKKIRYRPVSRDWTLYWSQILSLGLHTIDVLRAALGARLLLEAVRQSDVAQGALFQNAALTHALVFGAAVILQTFVCKERDVVNAPFTFVAGLLLGYLPPAISVLTILLATATACGARAPGGFFVMLPMGIFATGFLLTGRILTAVLVTGAVTGLLPWLLSAMSSRQFVVSYRARRLQETATPAPLVEKASAASLKTGAR